MLSKKGETSSKERRDARLEARRGQKGGAGAVAAPASQPGCEMSVADWLFP